MRHELSLCPGRRYELNAPSCISTSQHGREPTPRPSLMGPGLSTDQFIEDRAASRAVFLPSRECERWRVVLATALTEYKPQIWSILAALVSKLDKTWPDA